jgi:hypothetical protein
MRTAIGGLFACMALCACVSPQVHQDSFTDIDFSRFKTIAYSVDAKRAEYADKDEGYGSETVSLFETLLGKRFELMGYRVVRVEDEPDVAVDIHVLAVKPGSGAARFFVGFGAGRAVFTFSAAFRSDGKTVAGFDGGDSYTGMELDRGAFQDKTQIQVHAAASAASQIQTFMLNGGKFPKTVKAKPRNPQSS